MPQDSGSSGVKGKMPMDDGTIPVKGPEEIQLTEQERKEKGPVSFR